MRPAFLLGALALIPLLALAGCEDNPLEDWAYQSTSAGPPEQGVPPPHVVPAASRTVDTAPLQTLQPQILQQR